MRRTTWTALALTLATLAHAAEPQRTMQLPADIRAQYRNPDGSCVQCSIGMVGRWLDVPAAYTLLWDTQYGPAVRGGSGPSRVANYAAAREMRIYNVTGDHTIDWMKWAAMTGRYAAIGAGTRHFQTLYGYDPTRDQWIVCNNNTPERLDIYTTAKLRQLHDASGRWIVILDYPPTAPLPTYE